MEESQDVYESLADHLDRLPSGFPRTSTGVEIRILKRLFTAEEAALAQLTGRKPETPEQISARTGRSAQELSVKLEAMSKRGLILRLRKDSHVRYLAAQFLIGIWEYHVNDLSPELISEMNEYLPHFFNQSYKLSTPQLRTVPIPKALPADQVIMPYEQARRIILEQEKIVVAPCICRKEHRMVGKGCGNPLETCLVFGAAGGFYEENGLGQPIDVEGALRILDDAEESGLVLQPSNCQKVVNICLCCGCCCQILKNLKRLPNPSQHVASNFYAVIDEAQCIGCGTCQERCQMNAVSMDGETAVIMQERCIGCGLCVPTCPQEAVHLKSKPDFERKTPPAHFSETYNRIAKERNA